jgi:hypothetical protein
VPSNNLLWLMKAFFWFMQLPEPFSFIFTWFAALPLIFWVAQAITNAIVKDFLILKVFPFSCLYIQGWLTGVHWGDCSFFQGPCPNCGNENLSFFGIILSVPSGGAKNSVNCPKYAPLIVIISAGWCYGTYVLSIVYWYTCTSVVAQRWCMTRHPGWLHSQN